MLFEAITGSRPFEGETLYDLMSAHLEQPPPSLRALRPELPAAIEHVVLTALAKRPDERFQSVTAMAQALNAAAAELPPEAWRPLSSRNQSMPLVSRGGSRAAPPIRVGGGAARIVRRRRHHHRRRDPSWPLLVDRRGRG